MKLVFIRHGDPDYAQDTLTPRGWREAACLAGRVAGWQVRDFFVSPLGRARDTAGVSLQRLGRQAQVLDWLTEFVVEVDDPATGGRRGIPWDLMPAYWTAEEGYYHPDAWCDTGIMASGPVREHFERVAAGLDGLLREYGYTRQGRLYAVEQGNEDTLVFFCHMGLTLAALAHLLHLPATALWHGMCVAPTSLTVLETEEREPGVAVFRARAIGDTAHLYAAGVQPSSAGFFEEVQPADPAQDRRGLWWEPLSRP